YESVLRGTHADACPADGIQKVRGSNPLGSTCIRNQFRLGTEHEPHAASERMEAGRERAPPPPPRRPPPPTHPPPPPAAPTGASRSVVMFSSCWMSPAK